MTLDTELSVLDPIGHLAEGREGARRHDGSDHEANDGDGLETLDDDTTDLDAVGAGDRDASNTDPPTNASGGQTTNEASGLDVGCPWSLRRLIQALVIAMTFAGVVFAGVVLWPSFASRNDTHTALILAQWTAVKEYFEYCSENVLASKADACVKALKAGVPPPPLFRRHLEQIARHSIDLFKSSLGALLDSPTLRTLTILAAAPVLITLSLYAPSGPTRQKMQVITLTLLAVAVEVYFEVPKVLIIANLLVIMHPRLQQMIVQTTYRSGITLALKAPEGSVAEPFAGVIPLDINPRDSEICTVVWRRKLCPAEQCEAV